MKGAFATQLFEMRLLSTLHMYFVVLPSTTTPWNGIFVNGASLLCALSASDFPPYRLADVFSTNVCSPTAYSGSLNHNRFAQSSVQRVCADCKCFVSVHGVSLNQLRQHCLKCVDSALKDCMSLLYCQRIWSSSLNQTERYQIDKSA